MVFALNNLPIVMRSSCGLAASVVLLCGSALAQAHAATSPKQKLKPPLPVFEIALSEDADYPSLPWPKEWMQGNAVEISCIGDGNVYVLKPGQGVVALTPSGIVSFLADKMTDIPHPSTTFIGLNPAISASGISFRVTGIDDTKVETTTSTDDAGHNHAEKNATNATIPYIARFDKDGTYEGAIKLDVPFVIYKFATFDSGVFIAQGMDQNKVPRIALLDTSAQFMRYLDLRKDVSTSQSVSGDQVKCDECTADMDSVVFSGYFTPWNGKALLKREFTGSVRIYEIQESGNVRMVNIKAPEGYEISELIPSDRNWLLRFNKPDARGVRPDAFDSLLEVDPQNGEPLREYRVKLPDKVPQTVISCVADGEFWGARHDLKEEKLKVVRGTAELYRGK
jgi:hypothetical protein